MVYCFTCLICSSAVSRSVLSCENEALIISTSRAESMFAQNSLFSSAHKKKLIENSKKTARYQFGIKTHKKNQAHKKISLSQATEFALLNKSALFVSNATITNEFEIFRTMTQSDTCRNIQCDCGCSGGAHFRLVDMFFSFESRNSNINMAPN